ncbi:MAG: hypothetical protein EA001_09100 [Oscillatoriales cyanobacterium]|nr:MAG: hypothetical protein EA001_09100 [Oscillatoriales cyanobacterium]
MKERTPEISYTPLKDLLALGVWKQADQETNYLLRKASSCSLGDSPESQDMISLSQDILRTIDYLWLEYSSGKFGLSVQSKLYREITKNHYPKLDLSSNKELIPIHESVVSLCKWGDKVHWRDYEEWLSYSQINFNNSACIGHLPTWSCTSFWHDGKCGHISKSFCLLLWRGIE